MEIKDKIGMLTIIKEVPKPLERKTKGKYYLCKCDCGNEKIIDAKGLRTGKVQSCGCLKKKRVSESITIDITGKKFGKLTVIEKVPFEKTKAHSEAMWICKCDCGTYCTVRGTSLRTGNTRSCGCLQKEVTSILFTKDEVGNQYGKLTVIKREGSNDKGDAYWLCKCECGNYKKVLGRDLRAGHTSSCGCICSVGEYQIAKILQENNIDFIPQYTNKTLKTENNGFYKFDFCIVDKKQEPLVMIEYQGKQHYEESNFFENLEKIQYRDLKKVEWCNKYKIPLIIISYMDNIKEKMHELITDINEDGTIKTRTERMQIEDGI